VRLTISSLAALLAFGLGSEVVQAAEKGEENEGAAISERARLELRTRGGAPRLSAAASEYGARRAERARGLRALALPDAAWMPVGPASAPGRMTALAPHPSVSGTLYAGAADGGLFRTTDGGASWTPLTDDVPNLSVGAVALAPSAPATIYVGTGEGGRPDSFVPGIGLVKSTDGGTTWTLPSAVVARQFFRISVHPSSPNVLLAATGAGGLLSTDGGASFATVIAPAKYGVVSDLARDASRPETLYAATWCPSGVACSNGPARILKSTDGGVTWVEKGSGISFTGDPDEARVAIAISRSAPNVLYAARAEDGVAHLYRSGDSAESWSEVAGVATSGDATVRGYMGGQSWYDNVLTVSPTNADVVFAGGLYTIRSTDGGRGFAHPAFAGALVHLDVHDLAFQGSTLWIATDGGVFSTSDAGDTARDANASLVTRQYYAVAQHAARPDRLLAGAQDNGTDQRAGSAWRSALGSDGFDCAYDALVPDVAWATAEYGRVFRSDASGTLDAAFREITPRWADLGESPPFRTVLVADPSRSGHLLTGASRVLESTDGGASWRPLGTAMSDGGSFGPDALGAIAISKGALLVTKGAAVLRSTDGGATWRNASGGLPGANVNGLDIDPRDSRVAWAALATTTGESVWGTTDGGVSWIARSGGLPPFAAHVVKADPLDAAALYAGTDVGVYRSTDAGASWARFGSGLPAVSVRSLAISGDGTLVRAATHGRGLYELHTAASAGNAPPVVSIVRPATGTSVAGGAPVAFDGSVSDPDGDAVAAFWTFGDTWETVALAGSASHAFIEKGVFPVTLTARDAKGAVSVASVLVTVTSDAQETPDPPRWLVAGMAYADGAGGTFWQSDFSVFNPDPSRSMTLSLAFLDGRATGSAAPRFVSVTIGPLRTRSFPNVLASAPFFLAKGSFGALLVRGDVLPAQPALSGRTYNAGSGNAGTFGLSVPAVAIPSGLTAQEAGGPPPTLIGLREVPGVAHTNLVLANLGSDPATVQITFIDGKGAALGTPVRADLAAYAVRQLNRVLAAASPEGAGVAAPAPSYAVLVTTLTGKVFPYATVIDDRTSDPIVISPAARAGASARLPGIVRTRGRNNTLFESDVVVQNPMARTRTVSIRYTFQSFTPSLPPSAVQSVSKTVTLGPKETLEIDDFVASWLGLADAGTTTAYASSYVDVTADDGDPVLVLGQTYNAPAGGGRIGFQIPGYTALDGASAAGANRRLVMAGLTSSAAYRTNVAFFLASGDAGSAAHGTVKLVDGNGRVLATRALSLSADAPFVQLNDADLFAGAGSSLTVVLDGVDGNAPIAAYATVIDNTSGDAVLAPGQPSP
jgi:PKD repeat protein